MDGTTAPPPRPRLRWRFADASFDEAGLLLTLAGERGELERRPLQLLALLLANAGEIVTKEEILDALWPGREVSEASLTTCMTRLRQALGTIGHSAIRTVHGYGYRFTAPVAVEATSPARPPDAVPAMLAEGDPVPHRPNWRLVRRLGIGGYGDVWLAEQTKSHERRVFKFARNEDGRAALRREVALSRLLREGLGPRPDLIRVLDWNFADAPAFIETVWAEQGNLADWAARQGGAAALPLDLRLELAVGIAEALAAIHGMSVLHKDVKPANVLMRTDEGGRPAIILADFGSGRALEPARLAQFNITQPDPDPTEVPSAGGTQMYRAPELAAGGQPTVQADIFALGILLFQLAAGDLRRPLTPSWEELIPDPLLREDISAAAAGDPSRRLGDAADLARRLRALPQRRAARAKEDAAAEEAARVRHALELTRARRLPVMALMGVLVLALAISTTLYVGANRAHNRAEAEAARARAVTAFLTNDLLSAANPLLNVDPNVPVRKLLGMASADLDQWFPAGGEDRAAIEAAIGSAYAGLSDHDRALPLLRAALATLRAQRGEDDAQTQAVRLAIAQLAEGMLDRPAMRAAGTAILAARPHDAATELAARFYIILGGCDTDGEACAAQLRPLVEEATRRLGPRDKLTLKIEATLAGQLGNALKFDEALAMSRKVIDETQLVYGADHLLVQQRRFDFAATLVQANRVDEAIQILIDVRHRLLALTGAETDISVRVLNQLGMAYYVDKRYQESLDAFRTTRDYSVATRGERSILSLAAENNIANALAHMGRAQEAIALAKHAYDIKREVEGADRPDTLWFERNLAEDYRIDGKLQQAETVLRDVVDRARKTMTHGEHILGQYESEFGELLLAEGKIAEAGAPLAESVTSLTRSLGAEDSRTVRARKLLDMVSASRDK